jgi:hypothetical protein
MSDMTDVHTALCISLVDRDRILINLSRTLFRSVRRFGIRARATNIAPIEASAMVFSDPCPTAAERSAS